MCGAVFTWAGNVGATGGQNSASHFAAHGSAGCVSAVADGGKCGQGAASALVGKFTTGLTTGLGGEGISGHLVRGATATISGGLASVAGGGEFKDGARTEAFGYAFNEMLSDKSGNNLKSRVRYHEGDWTLGGDDPGVCLCSSAPRDPQKVYDELKLIATPFAPLMLLPTGIDLTVAGFKGVTGDSTGAALGAGSLVAGQGVDLVTKPLGGASSALGHLAGMGYDHLAKPAN